MNLIGPSVQLLFLEIHAGRACGYIKKLTNFQNKNSHISHSQISKKKKKKKKKRKKKSETGKYYYQQYYYEI